MGPNESLEELAAARRAARFEKERKRLERKAARLASKQGRPGAASQHGDAAGAADEAGRQDAPATAALAVVRPKSKAEKKAAIKEAKRRHKEAKAARKAAAATKEKDTKSVARMQQPRTLPAAAAATEVPGQRGKKRGLGALAKQLDRERQQKKKKGVLIKHGKYDYASMAGGKISNEELAELRGENIEQAGYSTKLIGYTLGWSKSNGGFGSKADTIARDARTHGTVGKARTMETS